MNDLHREVPKGRNSRHGTEMIPECPYYIKSNNCINLIIV